MIDRAKFAEARDVQTRNVAALARFRDLAALRYREGAATYLAVATAEQSSRCACQELSCRAY
jgi:outer membrane protein TolC